jgi:hypothetical protein
MQPSGETDPLIPRAFLPPQNPVFRPVEPQRWFKPFVLFFAAIGWAALVGLAVWGPVNTPKSSIVEMDTASNFISLVVQTPYSRLYGFPGQDYPWVNAPVVDPFRDAWFQVKTADVSAFLACFGLLINIRRERGTELALTSGPCLGVMAPLFIRRVPVIS